MAVFTAAAFEQDQGPATTGDGGTGTYGGNFVALRASGINWLTFPLALIAIGSLGSFDDATSPSVF